MSSYEQQARDLMEQCGWDEAQGTTAGDVVWVASKLREIEVLKIENDRLRNIRITVDGTDIRLTFGEEYNLSEDPHIHCEEEPKDVELQSKSYVHQEVLEQLQEDFHQTFKPNYIVIHAKDGRKHMEDVEFFPSEEPGVLGTVLVRDIAFPVQWNKKLPFFIDKIELFAADNLCLFIYNEARSRLWLSNGDELNLEIADDD